MFCQFGFRTAKSLQQEYLLPLFLPSHFQHLQALHQQIQDLLNFNPRMGHTKTSFVQQESFLKKSVNPKSCVSFPATQAA
jgi:hypothetical protein